jgi:hypothetical protein
LQEYKDSEEAKTKILEIEAKKRELLAKQEAEALKSASSDLRELLIQRDDVANSNVFKRLRSREQQKSDALNEIDRDIADKVLEIQKGLELGITPLDSLGINQILEGVNALNGQTNNIEILINQAEDPNAVREEVTRALDSFINKIYGANVA